MRHTATAGKSLGRTLSALALALVWHVLLPATEACAADLVSRGATWLYLDDGSDPGSTWRELDFSDEGWNSGPAQLGYGDADESTVVNGGPAGSRQITTYFRKHFDVADPSDIAGLELQILRDDGAVVYLNGIEIFRTNMPAGTITANTTAVSGVGGVAESTFLTAPVLPTVLVSGHNLLAVEIHQVGPTSSDISFDLVLRTALPPGAPSLVRGPYLQLGTQNSIRVRWRTDAFTNSRLAYGPSPGNLTTTIVDPLPRTEHEVAITGLSADTQYYYEIGNDDFTLAGDDPDHYFRTSPRPGTRRPTRIWVIGDSGECAVSTTACHDVAAVMNQYLAWAAANGGRLADLVLILGDNAYFGGTDAQYTTGLFEAFGDVLRNHVLWPVPGNHEFPVSDSASQTGPYYEAFSLPTAGEAGGVASGTEAYYSFDFGNIHFSALDSHDTPRAAPPNPTENVCPGGGGGGTMYNWLCADLAETTQDWIFSFWHHPPYTKGSHNSDFEAQLVQMRENFNPVLEAHGVDLNLTGHSHSYERSILLDGHYGNSASYNPVLHAKDPGSGDPLGDGAYQKPALGPIPNEGLVYSVVGSSSKNSGGLTQHPIMAYLENIEGSLVLDVSGNQLDGYFITKFGGQNDHFRILKGHPAVCGDQVVEGDEQCDDGNALPGDCCSAECRFEPAGGTCDDGRFCTTGETCSSLGVCTDGRATDCSESSDQCNAGVCNELSDRCEPSPTNEGGSCDDGLFCSTADTCSGGTCLGAQVRDCSESGDQCNAGVCNEASDRCEPSPTNEGGDCDDGLFCNVEETCSAGVCGGGLIRDCSVQERRCRPRSCADDPDRCERHGHGRGNECRVGSVCHVEDRCSGRDCSGYGSGGDRSRGHRWEARSCDDDSDSWDRCHYDEEDCDEDSRRHLEDSGLWGNRHAHGNRGGRRGDHDWRSRVCNEVTDRCERLRPDDEDCDDDSDCRVEDPCADGGCASEALSSQSEGGNLSTFPSASEGGRLVLALLLLLLGLWLARPRGSLRGP